MSDGLDVPESRAAESIGAQGCSIHFGVVDEQPDNIVISSDATSSRFGNRNDNSFESMVGSFSVCKSLSLEVVR